MKFGTRLWALVVGCLAAGFVWCAEWTYEVSSKVLTDGVWGFTATRNASGEITIGALISEGYANAGMLDLGDGSVRVSDGSVGTIVGFSAFLRYHEGLTGLRLAPTVRTLPDYAFFYCTNLGEIFWESEQVTTLPPNCFTAASTLGSITNATIYLPNLKSAGSGVFNNQSNLSIPVSNVLPRAMSQIPGTYLRNCAKVYGEVHLDQVSSIGHQVFLGCKSITSAEIHGTASTIGEYTFSEMSSCSNVVIDLPNLTVIPTSLLTGTPATNPISQVCHAGIRIIRGGFNGTRFCGDLVLTNVEVIARQAFQNCKNLTSIQLDSSTLTNLNPFYTFAGCSSVTNILLGASDLDTITANNSFSSTSATFADSKLLKSVVFKGPAPQTEKGLLFVDMTLKPVSAQKEKAVTIFAAPEKGWSELAAPVNPELDGTPPPKCFGVYVTQALERKAWLVSNSSRKPTVILLH